MVHNKFYSKTSHLIIALYNNVKKKKKLKQRSSSEFLEFWALIFQPELVGTALQRMLWIGFWQNVRILLKTSTMSLSSCFAVDVNTAVLTARFVLAATASCISWEPWQWSGSHSLTFIGDPLWEGNWVRNVTGNHAHEPHHWSSPLTGAVLQGKHVHKTCTPPTRPSTADRLREMTPSAGWVLGGWSQAVWSCKDWDGAGKKQVRKGELSSHSNGIVCIISCTQQLLLPVEREGAAESGVNPFHEDRKQRQSKQGQNFGVNKSLSWCLQ